jgi:hypothetical protein
LDPFIKFENKLEDFFSANPEHVIFNKTINELNIHINISYLKLKEDMEAKRPGNDTPLVTNETKPVEIEEEENAVEIADDNETTTKEENEVEVGKIEKEGSIEKVVESMTDIDATLIEPLPSLDFLKTSKSNTQIKMDKKITEEEENDEHQPMKPKISRDDELCNLHA